MPGEKLTSYLMVSGNAELDIERGQSSQFQAKERVYVSQKEQLVF